MDKDNEIKVESNIIIHLSDDEIVRLSREKAITLYKELSRALGYDLYSYLPSIFPDSLTGGITYKSTGTDGPATTINMGDRTYK